MRKICLFSTVFPSYHPDKGKPTYFPEKIVKGEKIHTIRTSPYFQEGDIMIFKHWKVIPYRSKQIGFFNDRAIKIQEIEMSWRGLVFCIKIDGIERNDDILLLLAKNDGLTPSQFIEWFTKGENEGELKGYIRHWTDFKY